MPPDGAIDSDVLRLMQRGSATTALAAYRGDIDGMRAIAVLLVLVFHFDLVSGSKAGFIGVDVFFVISGYLITSILTRQLDKGTFDFAAFYVARVRRLAPALLAVLLLTLAAGTALLFPDDLRELVRQAVASQFYVANFYFWKNVSYFGLGSDNVFLLHMWSLAVEEQFYLFYPLTLWLVYRWGRKWFWTMLGLGLVLSFVVNVSIVHAKPSAAFYLLPTRVWEFVAGALVPLASRWSRRAWIDEAIGALGIALLVIAVTIHRVDFSFPGFFALLPVIGATCLLVCGDGRSTVVSRTLSLRVPVYIGKISYPLYLVHWPINVLAKRSFAGDYDIMWRFGAFGLSFLLAALIYHWVEDPIRHRRILSRARALLSGYGAGLAVTVLVFMVVAGTNGLPQRFPPEVVRLANFVHDQSPPLNECEFADKPLRTTADFCTLGVKGGTPKWLVYGDSHAWAAHDAFDKWLALKGESGLFIFRNSCPPILGIHILGDQGRCYQFNQSAVDFLRDHIEIGTVVLVSTWHQAPEARITTSSEVALSKEQALGLFDKSFSTTLAELHRLGRKIYIWEPVPGATKSVPIAMARAVLEKRPARIEFSKEQYLADNSFFFTAIANNKDLITVLLSPAEALCKGQLCAATIDGNPAYFDNAHIARSGTDFWVGMMQRSEQGVASTSR
jgi:peptidoglycan/LPS O-acetylase OafA/YrhL